MKRRRAVLLVGVVAEKDCWVRDANVTEAGRRSSHERSDVPVEESERFNKLLEQGEEKGAGH